MGNLVNTNKVFLYDGSFEGLLTIAYYCIKYNKLPSFIYKETTYQNNLIDKPEYIESNLKISQYILKQIRDTETKYNIYTAFEADLIKNEEAIVFYIVDYFRLGTKLNQYKNKKSVIDIDNIVKKVNREKHRLKGFVRFKELKNGIFYSKVEPDHNVISSIAQFFKNRLRTECFIINDSRRHIVAYYDKKEIKYLYNVKELEAMLEDDNYEEMWKEYFKRISIKERENKKCQINFMPRRYWKNMLEVSEKNE